MKALKILNRIPNNWNVLAIIFGISLMIPGNLGAQSMPAMPNRFKQLVEKPLPAASPKSFKSYNIQALTLNPAPNNLPKRTSCAMLPKWSAESLPFFCKIEHNWAKTNHIPVKFRLGSVEYVDRLEGKIE